MNPLAYASEHKSTVIVGVVALGLGIAIAIAMQHTSRETPPKPKPPVTMVMIKPQPPPPPPPPIKPTPTITPPKMATPTPKPMLQAPKPNPAPPKAPGPVATHMGTSIHGGAPDAFNLSGDPGGNGMFDGGGGGGGGSALAYYESQVQTEIQQALQNNPKTRHATAGLGTSISIDPNGNVIAVRLLKSSGDAALDAAIVDQILRRLRFPPPPPGVSSFEMNLTGQAPL